MCRFLIYKGKPTVVSNLIIKPEHSLIKQSYFALEREEHLNGDGFGVGWYSKEITPIPGLFVSLTPAWGNRNLHRLSETIQTDCLFAHVRAATPGHLVSETNCHPFLCSKLLWMHNGYIDEFLKIKRKLQSLIKDEYYEIINGTTDSEHAFALFLSLLEKPTDTCTVIDMKEAMLKTIKTLNQLTDDAGVKGASNYNFAVTNGVEVVITRYSNKDYQRPESLYYIAGKNYVCTTTECRMIDIGLSKESVIVASEPLTETKEGWSAVEPNHLMTIDSQNQIELTGIS